MTNIGSKWKITDSFKTLEEAALVLDPKGEIVDGHGWEDTKEDAVDTQRRWLLEIEIEENQEDEN